MFLSIPLSLSTDVISPRRIPRTLPQLKAEVSLTSSTLEESQTSFAREEAARLQLGAEVSALRLDRERDLRDLRAAHSAELTAAREDGMRRAEEAAAARATEVRNGPRRGRDTMIHGVYLVESSSNVR